jgi:hypothetical protein
MQVNINLSGQPLQQHGSAWPAALPPAAGAAAAAAGYEEEGELQRLSQRMSTSMNISDAQGGRSSTLCTALLLVSSGW